MALVGLTNGVLHPLKSGSSSYRRREFDDSDHRRSGEKTRGGVSLSENGSFLPFPSIPFPSPQKAHEIPIFTLTAAATVPQLGLIFLCCPTLMARDKVRAVEAPWSSAYQVFHSGEEQVEEAEQT